MPLDPLKPGKDDSPYVAQQKREADEQLRQLLRDLKLLGFTYTKHWHVYRIRCRHGKFTYTLERSLAGRPGWNFFVIRAAHRAKCGKET